MQIMPYKARPWIVISAGVPTLLFWLNWTIGWHWFGRYDAYAAIESTMLFEFLLLLVWPRTDKIAKLSFNTRRAIALIAGVPFVPCAINWIFGWHWFGMHDKGAVAICMMLFVPFAFLVAPSPDEMRKYNKEQERRLRGDANEE